MTVFQASDRYVDLRARAELLSSVGAGVLGAGLALLFKEFLGALTLPLVVVGATVHGLAMYQKHHLDASRATARPRWITWAYWACWLLLLRWPVMCGGRGCDADVRTFIGAIKKRYEFGGIVALVLNASTIAAQ